MFSLQKFFGKDDKFFDLLEGSSGEVRNRMLVLTKILSQPRKTPCLEGFHATKEADKRITQQINEAIVTTFVSQLEKDDIEVLSAALYRILKTVKKIAERFIKLLQTELQATESEADDVLLDMEREFYNPGFPALKAVILKDLFSLNEKVVDRCRDAGNVISHVLLKNS